MNNDEREILSLSGHCRTLQHDMEMIKEQLENSCESVSDLKRKLARANADLKHWKTKYEADALSKIDEIDEQNMKLKSKLDEVDVQKKSWHLNMKCL